MNNNEIRSTRLILKGDKELAATHAGDAKNVLAQLGNIQQTGPGGKAIQTITKQFLDGTVIKARTDVKGLNIVEITSGRFFEGKEEEQKKKTEQNVNVNRYVAPAILCYLDTDSDYDSVPDLFVIMDKFQNFSYVYAPTKIDEVSKKISETYYQSDIEQGYEISEYKFYYGSPDKNFFSKTENTERKISIRELVNCTYPGYNSLDYIYREIHNTEEVTDPIDTDCPQVGAYTYNKEGDFSSWVSVFGKICNKKYGNYSETAALRFLPDHPPTETCPYGTHGVWYASDEEGDFYSVISSGEYITVAGRSIANPNIPEDTSEDKLFSDYSDAYFYSTKTSGWSYAKTDRVLSDSEKYLSISCDLTLFAKGKNGGEDSSCEFNILTGYVDDSYEDTININFIDSLISNYNGNPVILISYYPERKIDNSYVYGDDYFKVTYIMFYKGKIFKSNLSTEIPAEILDAEQYNEAHELLNSKGESFTFKNKKYYSFGKMRLVEVTEETLIYT